MVRGKSVAVGDEVRSKGVVVENGKRAALRTKEAMDFDLKLRVLRGQKEVDEYLAMYDVHFPSKIEVEWCLPETDVIVSPPTDGVYFHPQVLTWGGSP